MFPYSCGVLPKLVEMLHWDHAPEVQYEAAWVLTNVSSGTPAQVRARKCRNV